MLLRLAPGPEASRAFVDLRSKGLISALDHQLTFTGVPALTGSVASVAESRDGGGGGDANAVSVAATLTVTDLQPPKDASSFDRGKMLDNLRGKDVLDAAKWRELTFRGRYRGTNERGTLEGELAVRGAPRTVAFAVVLDVLEGGGYRAKASWEGTLTSLGIKPFKALLGALRLEDWARIRVEVTLVPDV